MSISSESAEQVTRVILQGEEICLKATGKAAKELLVLIAAIMSDKTKTKGKTRLSSMLKSGKELKVFSVKQEDLKEFYSRAKQYGVLYSALVNKNKKSHDGMVDIMVRAEDASKINRIVERFNIATTDEAKIKSEIQRDKEQQSKISDPLVAKKTQKNLSKNSLEMSKGKEVNTKLKRKSVRQELKEVKKELANIDKVKNNVKELSNLSNKDKNAR